jgi:hypothetical protein
MLFVDLLTTTRVILSLRRIVVRLVSTRIGTLADPDSSLALRMTGCV